MCVCVCVCVLLLFFFFFLFVFLFFFFFFFFFRYFAASIFLKGHNSGKGHKPVEEKYLSAIFFHEESIY